MRAVIDADHLPHAVRFYKKVPHEPAQQLKDDISINQLDAVNNLTLEVLLQRISDSGENEFMIVLHSNPDGLVLPIARDLPANIRADKSVLRIISLASEAFDILYQRH